MTSRSCTYLRSVSTSSLMMLARAPPGSTAVVAREGSDVRESVDASADASVGDDGADSKKRSSGSCWTRFMTLLTTCRTKTCRTERYEKSAGTHLDEAVGRITVPKIPDSEALTVGYLLDVHGKKSDSVLLCTLVGGVKRLDVGVYGNLGRGGGEDIEEVAQRDA